MQAIYQNGGCKMLKVDGLNKTFYGFSLKNIDLHIPKGYICGLIGENGAGKSTLIKTIIGLYKMEEGSVVVDGMKFDSNEAQIKDMLGIVLDECIYNPGYTPLKIGKLYGPLYTHYEESAYLDWLKKFNVPADKKIKQLSKGMQIKFQLAFALSHKAKLFIFDEPTAGLDSDFRKEFLDICMELIEDGERSILFSTHITEDLDRVADYITFIQDGEILLSMTKEELCSRFVYVQAENYKLKLLKPTSVVHREEGTYGGSALVVNSKQVPLDNDYEKRVPTVEEVMYYFVKGGKAHAKDIIELYVK
ncbi:MAG: ABC transporter ATP-binding protein [Lachnospira sp.]|nr:ABC transporter ATP-binding protein [Lachnospira sp.]